MKRDLQAVGICDGSWYSAAQHSTGGIRGKHGAKAHKCFLERSKTSGRTERLCPVHTVPQMV